MTRKKLDSLKGLLALILCTPFFCFANTTIKKQASIIVEGQKIGMIEKTIIRNADKTSIHIKIYSTQKTNKTQTPPKTLSFERWVEAKGLHVTRYRSRNYEFPDSIHIQDIQGEYSMTRNKETESIGDSTPTPVSAPDLLEDILKKNWSSLIKNGRIDTRFISAPRESILDLEITYLGVTTFNKRKNHILRMAPSSTFLQAMMHTLGLDPRIYIDDTTKTITQSTGPMFYLPGHKPNPFAPKTAKIVWQQPQTLHTP